MPQSLVESFSGIRGIYGPDVNEKLAQEYVFSYIDLFDKQISRFIIAGDSRPSTPALKQAIIKALKKCGVKQIIDVGIVPVQVTEYAVQTFRADGGVYVSASHNQPNYNGFKFLKKDGAILYAEQAGKLIEAVHNFKEGRSSATKEQQDTEIINKQEEAVQNYINLILKKIGSETLEKMAKSRIKILVDPNGGSAINVLEKLFNRISIEAEIVNNNMGEFNRIVEPNAESLGYLADKMKGGKFEFACGFDCDADRVEYVLNPETEFAKETNIVLNGNYVLALACEAVLKGTKGEVVVTTDASSYLIRDVMKKHQAIVKEVEVGEINVVEGMERSNSLISGEGSSAGAIVLPIKCRDGIMATALILKMIVEENKSLLEILDAYPRYYQLKEKVKCSPDKVTKFKELFESYFKDKGYEIQKTGDETGGLKAVADENNFVWCRQSKTEPGAFRIWADGNNKKKVQDLIQEAIELFNNFKE